MQKQHHAPCGHLVHAARRFVLDVRVRAQKWPLRVPRHAFASERARASCPRDTSQAPPPQQPSTARKPRGALCVAAPSPEARVPTRCRTAEAAPTIKPAPTHRPPFHSGLFGAALAAWLSPLSHLLLLLLLALSLLEEALLFFKSLWSFTPLLDATQMPVKRKAGS